MKQITVVTTFHKPGLELYGQSFLDSWAEHVHPDIKLKVYTENLKTLPSGLKNIGFKKHNSNEILIDYKPSRHSIDELINEVVRYNIKVKDISIKDTTLEDLFKEITR